MIVSVSRQTDIPSQYADWFFHRLREGFVLVRNPVNPHQVSCIRLTPDVVDGIVFWTKNPAPLLERLDELQPYPHYFQFTLNAYGRDIEPNVPSKNDVVIPAFQTLSNRLGRHRVVWRYDPIFLNETYTVEYHCQYFKALAQKLHSYTDSCTISFLDQYPSIQKSLRSLHITEPTLTEKRELAARFAAIAAPLGLTLTTCAEAIDLESFGIAHGHCIDQERLEKICGGPLDLSRDKNQRPMCGCASSIDIGLYNTCGNGCVYCYANHSAKQVQDHLLHHSSTSPLLSGELMEGDVVTERPMWSCRDSQTRLLDL